MVAYQFIHLETYSRKGRDGRGVDFIFAEAERRPGACLHVPQPSPPETVFGVDVHEVRRLHDERAADATSTTKAGKSRRIRTDQNTLLTVVASHPSTMDSVRADPCTARAVRDWERKTVQWLSGLYGPALVSVIRHTDETHPHLHAFILPDDPAMRAVRLHPGQEAKAQIVAAGSAEGEDGKAVNRRGDAAYRSSMRAWQDSYWQAVGLPCGLTRLGPGRRRLSREEWQAERTQADAVRTARERVESLRAAGNSFVTKIRRDADTAMRAAQVEAAEIRASAIATKQEAARLHDAAEIHVRTARSILSQARWEGSKILEDARAGAARFYSIGSRIRSLWDGLQRSRIESRLRQSVADDVNEACRQADMERQRVGEETRRRHEAERAREAAITAAQALGRERDAARRQLAALLPDATQLIQHGSGRTP